MEYSLKKFLARIHPFTCSLTSLVQNNALVVIVEGTKKEKLVNVHVAATIMKPIELNKTFEGGTLPKVNR